MELIAAAVAFYAACLPVFLWAELAAPLPRRRPTVLLADAETAAAAWLAAHRPAATPRPVAANDEHERLAA